MLNQEKKSVMSNQEMKIVNRINEGIKNNIYPIVGALVKTILNSDDVVIKNSISGVRMNVCVNPFFFYIWCKNECLLQ